MSKYIEFEEVPYEGKTKRFLVMSKSQAHPLGKIQWYPAWRQYVFSPAFETVWNRTCLEDIQFFLTRLMEDRRC